MNIDFSKGPDGLLPAIVQDVSSGMVLMLGYMNEASLERSLCSGLVTFFSRSRGRLWTKGESSGNTLLLISVDQDCDGDALLVAASPTGPTCHNGTASCFCGARSFGFLGDLERVIESRRGAPPNGTSMI